tara:strand:- start:9736 stop:10347 length:612 start_codon:yes stop_codon:yes gene_type:complete
MNLDIKLHKEDLPDQLMLSDNIAVDCEFMGLNVERDSLCLVQISTGNNDAHIIQLNRDKYNAPNLKKILSDKNINKIFHYARADLLFIKKYLNIDVVNIDCTKIMSKLARSYSDKHGLKDLIKEFKGIDINKNLQSSDFGGNLSEKQLQYCAKDVIYLHEIYENLRKILIREKREKLYADTIKFINSRVNLDLASFTSDIWSH